MIKYILPYENIATGGAELLIGMIAKYIKKNSNEDVIILCKTIDNNMEKYFEQNSIEIVKVAYWTKARVNVKGYDKNSEIRIIVLMWEDLMLFSSIKQKNIKVILWMAHFQGLRIGETCRFKIGRSIIKRIALGSIIRLLKTSNIVCLDEMGVLCTEEYFGTRINRNSFKIIRMPIEIVDIDNEIMKKRSDMCEMNILTIARADFPFKGYLLGLVDFVERLEKRGENFFLTIISYGSGIRVLEERISQCSNDTRNRITLLGKTDYTDLEKYYLKTKLYIGMDTTIIDAAQRGIISIPVAADTYELICDKFYHEDAVQLRKDKAINNNIETLFNTVKNMNDDEYYSLSLKSRQMVIHNFSSNVNVGNFLKIFNGAKENRVYLDVLFFSYLYRIILTMRERKE